RGGLHRDPPPGPDRAGRRGGGRSRGAGGGEAGAHPADRQSGILSTRWTRCCAGLHARNGFEGINFRSPTRMPLMHLSLLKTKIHRATVTHSELNYEGSIAIDGLLLDATGIRE